MIGFIIIAIVLLTALVDLIAYAKAYKVYIVMKYEEPFITCTGSRTDAEHIAETLNKECRHEQM